jgi:hypothetical protein
VQARSAVIDSPALLKGGPMLTVLHAFFCEIVDLIRYVYENGVLADPHDLHASTDVPVVDLPVIV